MRIDNKKRPKLVATFRKETEGASPLLKFLLFISIVGYGFEIGPGNEWLVSAAGKITLKTISGTNNYLISGAVVGLVLFLISLIEHLALGSIMYCNLRRFPKTIAVIQASRVGRSRVLRNSLDRTLFENFANAFSIGAATVNLEDSLTDKAFLRANKGWGRTVRSALLIAFGSFIIGIIAGTGVAYALQTNNHQLAHNILSWVANPLVWAGLFLLVRCRDYLFNRAAQQG